ncbi:MAG TPA: histidine kinase dimerization/phospho-acceptor domain-containing protein, partial [Spirochaetota bacterium]|nr:histidine kinase dimerization/phospho-acceptor domain-containing protein [Spirochaetota bacterium]
MNDLTPVVEKIIRNFNHELKNPLTTIKGYAQLLGSKANDPQFVEKSRNIIIENVDDIDSKMNRMYDIFNLPGGERDAINPGEII